MDGMYSRASISLPYLTNLSSPRSTPSISNTVLTPLEANYFSKVSLPTALNQYHSYPVHIAGNSAYWLSICSTFYCTTAVHCTCVCGILHNKIIRGFKKCSISNALSSKEKSALRGKQGSVTVHHHHMTTYSRCNMQNNSLLAVQMNLIPTNCTTKFTYSYMGD